MFTSSLEEEAPNNRMSRFLPSEAVLNAAASDARVIFTLNDKRKCCIEICTCAILTIVALLVGCIVVYNIVDTLQNLPGDPEERAKYIVRYQVPLIDGHNDLPWRIYTLFNSGVASSGDEVCPWEKWNPEKCTNKFEFRLNATRSTALRDSGFFVKLGYNDVHTDIPRIKDIGLLSGQFWSVWVPCEDGAVPNNNFNAAALRQINIVHQLAEIYPQFVSMVSTGKEIVSVGLQQRKIASLIGIEGGHMIENSIPILEQYYKMGARYMTLTHTCNTEWATSSTSFNDTYDPGLSDRGVEIIAAMNRLGMLVDLSHVSPETMIRAIRVSKAPVMFSHSGVFALNNHPRNVPDKVIDMVKDNNGVIMVNYYPLFVSKHELAYFRSLSENKPNITDPETVEAMLKWQKENPTLRASLNMIVDHMEYIRNRTQSCKNIGIGSDFDGIDFTPANMVDTSMHYKIAVALYRRGFSDECVRQIVGENILRVLQKAEEVATALRKESPTSSFKIN